MSAPGTPDVALEAALEAWQDGAAVAEVAARPSRAAALTAHALALSFVVVAGVLAAHAATPGVDRLAELMALVALYVIAYRVEFTASAGSMVPTQPVLVALLLAGSPELVPTGVLVAVLIGGRDTPPSGARLYDWSVRALPAWHSLGPVGVLLAAGVTAPGREDWRWLTLGMLAQFAIDALVAAVRMTSIGVSPLSPRAPAVVDLPDRRADGRAGSPRRLRRRVRTVAGRGCPRRGAGPARAHAGARSGRAGPAEAVPGRRVRDRLTGGRLRPHDGAREPPAVGAGRGRGRAAAPGRPDAARRRRHG